MCPFNHPYPKALYNQKNQTLVPVISTWVVRGLTHAVESSEQYSEPLLLAQQQFNTVKFILQQDYPIS